MAILLLAFSFWPIAWAVRRRYKAPAPVAGRALRAQRATRLMAGLDVGLLIAWLVAATALLGDSVGPTLPLLLQIAGIVIFFGAVLVSGWNLWLTWTDGRGWTRKLASLLVFLSTLLVLYVALMFHLTALRVHY